MSIYGSQVLSDIELAHGRARDEVRTAQEALSQWQNRHATATSELQEAYEQLMLVRTQNPQAKREGLADVDAWLLVAAQKREASYEALLTQLTQANALASQLDQVEAVHAKANNDAQAAWDNARQSMRETLAREDQDFIQAEQRVADAVRRSRAVDTHLEEISATTKAFVSQCDADALFQYCARRRVGLAGCEGNFLTRALDRLVARASGYYQNRKLLTDAEQDLDQWVKHQALLRVELATARAHVEQSIDTSLETPAGRKLSDTLEEAVAQLSNTQDARKRAHDQASLLASQKEEFDQEQDPQSRQMRDRVFEAIASASDKVLSAAAAETTSIEDDRAALSVAKLRKQIPTLSQEVERATEQAEQAAAQSKRLATLASNFSSRGYGGHYSRFDYGFDTGALITGVMLGRMSVNQAMGRMDTSHRDVTPPPPPPPSPSYGSSSSGGFSSGSGFGGGGGHSTGGGF